MTKKFTTEKVIKMFEEIGYEYVDGECNSNADKLVIRDKDGYLYYNAISNFIYEKNGVKRSPNMQPFGKHNPFSIENIKNYIKLNGIETKLLDDVFVSTTTKMKWQCSCGNIFERNFNKFQGGSVLCTKCSKANSSAKTKTDETIALKILSDKGWKLQENETYTNMNTYINVINEDGYKARTTVTYVKSCDANIDIIGKCNPFTIENINLYMIKNNLPYTVLSEEYNSNVDNLLIKCNKCNETFYRAWSKFQNKTGMLCPNCRLKSKSYLEWLVKMWLKENDISFVMEKRFYDCRNKIPLPFDFYIEDKNVAIEVDGLHHYEPINLTGYGKENPTEARVTRYNTQVINDEIKNKYCEDNNIVLIRIPYWEFKDDTYLNKLNKLKEIL